MSSDEGSETRRTPEQIERRAAPPDSVNCAWCGRVLPREDSSLGRHRRTAAAALDQGRTSRSGSPTRASRTSGDLGSLGGQVLVQLVQVAVRRRLDVTLESGTELAEVMRQPGRMRPTRRAQRLRERTRRRCNRCEGLMQEVG